MTKGSCGDVDLHLNQNAVGTCTGGGVNMNTSMSATSEPKNYMNPPIICQKSTESNVSSQNRTPQKNVMRREADGTSEEYSCNFLSNETASTQVFSEPQFTSPIH